MFAKYAERARSARLVEYEVTELVNDDGTHPVLFVEKIDEYNATFLEERVIGAGATVDETSSAQQLARSRDMIAHHAVRRLGRVFRDDGTPADVADIVAFVHALPLPAFLRLSRFCSRDADAEPAVSAAELAEKS